MAAESHACHAAVRRPWGPLEALAGCKIAFLAVLAIMSAIRHQCCSGAVGYSVKAVCAAAGADSHAFVARLLPAASVDVLMACMAEHAAEYGA